VRDRQPPPNDTCAGAIEILRCGTGVLEGTTLEAHDDYQDVALCLGYAEAGNDVVYRLTPDSCDAIRLTYVNHDANGAVYIVTDCGAPNASCVAAADATGAGEAETLEYMFPQAGVYYLILDSRGEGTGGSWTMEYRFLCQEDQTWISLDGSPPDTPAELDCLGADEMLTFVDLRIHGFWAAQRNHEGTGYQEIQVPGLGTIRPDQPGAPALPVCRFDLAIPTDATQATFLFDQTATIAELDGYRIWPRVFAARDDTTYTEEEFVIDPLIYGQSAPWPPYPALPSAETKQVFGIPAATCTVYPIHWNPATGNLSVREQSSYMFEHGGSAVPHDLINRDNAEMASRTFANWEELAGDFPVNTVSYMGEFLFLTPGSYASTIRPLVNQKKKRGFATAVVTIPESGNTCASVRSQILTWYVSTPANATHYALLIGDKAAIPPCFMTTLNYEAPPPATINIPTDDLFASMNGDDINPEVYVGRLSVDGTTDLSRQITKILRYEDSPPAGATYFDDVLLVAHRQKPRSKYVKAQQKVASATYTVSPTFHTQYGNLASVTNLTVSNEIEDGLGLVCYRGHGGKKRWYDWNTFGEDYGNLQVFDLYNFRATPVVWSLACENSAFAAEDCIAEVWLERTDSSSQHGAVSHYGATIPSSTPQNDELDYQLFQAVYDKGITTQSHAIAWAENMLARNVGEQNAYMYMLLGDPQMIIRREIPSTMTVQRPPSLVLCPGGGCLLDVRVTTSEGTPIEGAIVGAFKPGPGPDDPDEVLANRYTVVDGWAHVPVEPTTVGWLHLSIQDRGGSSVTDSIYVNLSPAEVSATPDALPLRLSARPSIVQRRTFFDWNRPLPEGAILCVWDVAGRNVARLQASAGSRGATWDCRDRSGNPVGSGVYFARIAAGAEESRAQVIVLR
jgi:hypothetical protein